MEGNPSIPVSISESRSLFMPLSTSEEKSWAVIAHLSILLNLVSGCLGPILALSIYIIYRDRSAYVRFHALQALFWQLVAWILVPSLAGALWILSFLLLFVFGIGLLVVPLAILVSLSLIVILPATVIYGIIGAIECNHGREFRYWMIGPWTERFEPGGTKYETQEAMAGSSGATG